LFFSFQEEEEIFDMFTFYKVTDSTNNKPITASQDLMIQCLENDASSSFIQIHHFSDIMLLEAMVVGKSILMIL
jgi:hypothetical protein